MPAQGLIPFASNDPSGLTIPKGLDATSTPLGGSAFKDTNGTYGQARSLYIKGVNGYTLAPDKLPGNNLQSPQPGQGLNPVPNAAPTPDVSVQPPGTVDPKTGLPNAGTVVPVTMPPHVKSAIESAANSEGNGLGSGVPVNPSSSTQTPTVDYTLHPNETPDQYNARITQEQQTAGITPSGSSSSASGTPSLPNINDFLKPLGSAPMAPDLNATQSTAENQVGVPAIQQSISALTSQLNALMLDVQTRQGTEASAGGLRSIVNGRMAMISAQDNYAIKTLQGQLSDAQKQLTNANTAVDTIMKNTESNYADSEKSYNDQMTRAIALYTAESNQQDKATTQAQANIKVILDSFKGNGSVKIDPTLSSQFSNLELQAGFPTGTMQALISAQANTGGKFSAPIKNTTTGEVYSVLTSGDGKTQTLVRVGNIGNDVSGGTGSGILAGTTGSPTIDVTSKGYTSTAVAGGLSQAAIDQAALSFAMTGTMPSMGLGSTGAAGQRRVAIQNRAAELDAGGNIQANKATLSSNSKALATQVAYLNTTQRSLTNAENGIQQLTSAFQGKVNNSSIPLANAIANATKYQLGSADVNAYKAALAEVGNEYTQVFSRGGQVSDAVRGRANDIINGNINISDLKAVSDELQAQGNIVIQGAQGQVQSIQGAINNIITGGNSSSPVSSENQQSIQNDITQAIKDTKNFPNREALIPAIASEYGISQDQASSLVYQYWGNNAIRK